jgi:hypothetical protein
MTLRWRHAGGSGNGGTLDNAETCGSAPIQSDLAARHELFSGAVLGDGRFLVVGGMTWPADERLTSVERFVPHVP